MHTHSAHSPQRFRFAVVIVLISLAAMLLSSCGAPSLATDIQIAVVAGDAAGAIVLTNTHLSQADATTIEQMITSLNSASNTCIPLLKVAVNPASISTCVTAFSTVGNPALSPQGQAIAQVIEAAVQTILQDLGTQTTVANGAVKLRKPLGNLAGVKIKSHTFVLAHTTAEQAYDAAFMASLDPRTVAVWKMPTRNIAEYSARQGAAEALRAEGINYDWAVIAWGWEPYLVQGQRMTYGYTWVPGSLCTVQIGVTMSAPGAPFPGIPKYTAGVPYPKYALKVSQNPSDLVPFGLFPTK